MWHFLESSVQISGARLPRRNGVTLEGFGTVPVHTVNVGSLLWLFLLVLSPKHKMQQSTYFEYFFLRRKNTFPFTGSVLGPGQFQASSREVHSQVMGIQASQGLHQPERAVRNQHVLQNPGPRPRSELTCSFATRPRACCCRAASDGQLVAQCRIWPTPPSLRSLADF